jgi:hypothetical protein
MNIVETLAQVKKKKKKKGWVLHFLAPHLEHCVVEDLGYLT